VRASRVIKSGSEIGVGEPNAHRRNAERARGEAGGERAFPRGKRERIEREERERRGAGKARGGLERERKEVSGDEERTGR